MSQTNTAQAVQIAWKEKFVIPAFNIPYLPMVEPIVRALVDENSFGLIQVARLEWLKFESQSLQAVRDEFLKHQDPRHCALHLDHVPVIDEDDLWVDYEEVMHTAVALGYGSMMIDGSRLSLEENIEHTRKGCAIAHAANIPCEAELGAVMGHEKNPTMSYEEIFASGTGFTRVDEAQRFVASTSCDWLSVAIGNIHGAISGAMKDKEKPHARLHIDHLKRLQDAVNLPLVLHGGSGIEKEFMQQAVACGIAKVNVAFNLRQPYERTIGSGVEAARDAVYRETRSLLKDYFEISGSADRLR
jgi:fructose-bisphosphate aldolase, class II